MSAAVREADRATHVSARRVKVDMVKLEPAASASISIGWNVYEVQKAHQVIQKCRLNHPI